MAKEINVKVSGTWEELSEVHAKVSGVWEKVKEVYVKEGGVWEQVYVSDIAPTSVSVPNINPVTSDANSNWPQTIYGTATATVIPADTGNENYSYSWSYVSGTGITGGSETNNKKTFSAFVDPPFEDFETAGPETWRCTVSNSAGSVDTTFTVRLTGQNEGS